MAQLDTYDLSGQKSGTADLDDALFGARLNVPAMHQVVTAQLANARRGTSKTKSRSEVRGGGRKPWRQKGTGRARQGSIRAPQWTGGGIVHGPSGEQNHSKRASKKLKKVALASALSDRASSGSIRIVAGLAFDAPSTKRAIAVLESLDLAGKRVLVVLASADQVIRKSFNNLQDVHTLTVDQLNTYDVLVSDVVVFAEEALAFIGTGTRADLTTAAVADGSAGSADPAGSPADAPEVTA